MTRLFGTATENEDGAHGQDNFQNDERRPSLIYIEKGKGGTSGFLMLKYFFYILMTSSAVFGVTALIRAVASSNFTETCQCFVSNHLPSRVPSSLVVDTNHKFECSAFGDKHCQSLCVSLAMDTPGLYKSRICKNERYASKHVGTVYYRACAKDTWLHTSLQMTVCCRHGTEYICPENDAYY